MYQGNAYNCTFTMNQAYMGGAMYQGTATNCTFIKNHVKNSGGAIYHGNAYNSTFTNNSANWGGAIDTGIACNCTFTGHEAEYGGAIFNGSAYNCIFRRNTGDFGGAMWRGNASLCNFNGDTTYETNIIPVIINVLNYTSTYRSGERLKFNLTADNILFDGINTTIKIYQNGSLITTVYGLTGEGWIVDLIPGEYNAVLSLTDFPDEQSVNATIKVLKGNTTVVIKPINDVKVGQEVTINYTTNSNGTVTIKVNEEEIIGNKFTPTKEGTYNVIVEVAENEYYTAGYNQTTFTAEKTNTTVTINPITDVKVGKEITITYTTNSNETATIKVNKQTITDSKYTPTHEGTYTITIEIAENEYYTAGYNQTTFTAEKTNTTVTINPITDVKVGKEITITYTTNSNETATIKVNNQTITDSKYTPTHEGTYTITIEIAENEYYTPGYNQTTFNVEKLASKITAKPVSTTYNVGKNLVITLKDENGKPISGAVLTVNLGGSKKYTTNANGQVHINVATLTPKTYTAKITYSGSDNIKGSTASVKVTIKKATPKITAKTAIYKLRVKTKKYTAIFKDNKNKALKNTKVTLKIKGKTYKTKTNKKGQGIFKITNLKKIGIYKGTITLPTNKYYNKKTKTIKIIVIK